MKKYLLLLSVSCLAIAGHAQNLLDKVPATATMAIRYSGENFSKNIPLKKLDSYGFIKEHVFKMLHIENLRSVQNTGIDFGKDICQYVAVEDTCINFVTLLPLKNEAQFIKMIRDSYDAKKNTIQKNGYTFLPVSDGVYIGWNKTSAVIVDASYQNRQNYWTRYYDTIAADTVVAVADSTVAVTVDSAYQFTPPKIVDTTMAPESDTATMEIELAPMIEDQAKEEEERRIRDSISNMKWELWQQQQDLIARKQQEFSSAHVMDRFFSENIRSIKNEPAYTKIIDPAAHASIWINNEGILEQYWNFFEKGRYSIFGNYAKQYSDTGSTSSSALNIYFDKDKMRMETSTFSLDPQLDALGKSVMNSRQSNSLLGYVNPGNIGYFSVSINSEAMTHYYYEYMRRYLAKMYNMREYSEVVDIYIDLLEILLDEKGIADLLPGNYMFVMHDMKPRIVNYTDYEYDDEFNRKEVKKTKKELSPLFTFAFETHREDFLKKLAKLPVKYAEKSDSSYKWKEGGYYELAFKEGEMPFSSMYFMVKDGKGIVTTSKEVIDMTLAGKTYTPDENTRNSVLGNNYSVNISSKRLIEKLSTQLSTESNKKVADYLIKNLGDLKMETGIRDGMIRGTTTLQVTGNNSNSLEFLFNMMDSINNIMEQEKQEGKKKIN